MSIDLRNELRRAAGESGQPPHDYAGDLVRGQGRLRRRRRLVVAASAAPVVAVAIAGVVVGPELVDRSSSSPPPIAASPTADRSSSAAPSTPTGQQSPTSSDRSSGPSSPTSAPTTSSSPGPAESWQVTGASLQRDMPKAMGCQVVFGRVWVCNGAVQGKQAMAYWADAGGIVFGDPAYSNQAYVPELGLQGVAYPSEVWQAIARYLVPPQTADKITAWLQQHNSGETVIDGLAVVIDGPIASVGKDRTPLPEVDQPPDNPALLGHSWRATMASLRRDMPKALNCTVTAGEMVWVCNGSTLGKAAKAYWSDPYGIAFGSPAAGEHGYSRQPGTSGTAYPSEVWQAIAPYLVSSQTADKITAWLQNHNRGRTTIDGLSVGINGPSAGVSIPGVER